jgi:hypothetical protein
VRVLCQLLSLPQTIYYIGYARPVSPAILQELLKNDPGLRLVEQGPDVVTFAANYATYLDLPQEVRAAIQKAAALAKPGCECR